MNKIYWAVILVSTYGFFSLSVANAEPANDSASAITKLPELTPDNVSAPTPKLMDIVDFTQLRNEFGKRSDFQMRCELSRPTKEWAEAMQAKKFRESSEILDKWFDKCPVDARAHLWAIASLKELGELEKIEQHKRWWFGLTDSILQTGDGKSPQTAFVTISISEEYAMLVRLNLQRVKQQLINGPPLVDLIVAEQVGGGEDKHSVYFNPQWHFIRLMHMEAELKKSK